MIKDELFTLSSRNFQLILSLYIRIRMYVGHIRIAVDTILLIILKSFIAFIFGYLCSKI